MKVLVLIILSLCVLNLEGGEVPDFEHSYVKKEWIRMELSYPEFMKKERLHRIERIKWWSEIQFDEENPWNLNGKEGKGAMPWDYYQKRIEELLVDPEYFAKIKKIMDAGARLYFFDTSKSDWDRLGGARGYILLQDETPKFYIVTEFN